MNQGEAAIGFGGKISLDGLLPSAGGETRIGGGDDRYGAAPVAGVTLRGAGFFGAALIGPKDSGEGASSGSGLAGGGAFRAVSPFEPLCSGLLSGLANRLAAIVGDDCKSAEGTFAKDSEYRVLSLELSLEAAALSSL